MLLKILGLCDPATDTLDMCPVPCPRLIIIVVVVVITSVPSNGKTEKAIGFLLLFPADCLSDWLPLAVLSQLELIITYHAPVFFA